MVPSTLERKDGAWLAGHADAWVEAGLIAPDQADAIRRYEHLDEPAAPQRLTLVAEVASYLGSVIAFAGGAAIIGPNWEALGWVGQLAVGFAIALVGFVVGGWLVHLAEAGTERLGSFLWAVATGGVAMAAAVTVHEIDPRDGAWNSIAVGVPVLAIGAGLWRNLDRPLQLLTAVGGLGATLGGVRALTDLSMWAVASGVWLAAAAFGVAAAVGRVRPRLVSLAVGAVGAMIGAMMFGDVNEDVAPVLATITAAVVVVYALHERSLPLLALGVVEFFFAIMMAMATLLTGVLPRLIAVVVGLAVVAAVAVRAQRMGRAGPGATAS